MGSSEDIAKGFIGPIRPNEQAPARVDDTDGGNFDNGLIAERPALFRHALVLTRNEAAAQDLVQDTCMKALANRHTFQPGTNQPAWLHRILQNHFLSNYRKEKNRERIRGASSDAAIEGVAAIESSESLLLTDEALKALGKLPDDQRRAIQLVGILGYSYEDAAIALDVAVGTIKSRVNRGREKLREILQIEPDSGREN